MIYILVALRDELPELPPEWKDCRIIYTGVGKVNAAIMAAKTAMADDCQMIINYGSAGALETALVGTLSVIKTVRQRDMDARPLCDLGITPFDESGYEGDIDLEDDGVILSSGDQFVTAPPEVTSQMVDMEAYAIAKVAKMMGVPIKILKYGSDFADENASNDWAENCAKGADMFWDWMTVHVEKLV